MNLISSEKNNYFLIADLHLDGSKFPEYENIVSTLSANKHYGVVFVGDTLDAHYTMKKALDTYPEFFTAVNNMKEVYFIKGNSDPDISRLCVVYDVHKNIKICHGNISPDCVNRIINKFKFRKFTIIDNDKKKLKLIKRAKKIFDKERIIIGHLHFEYFDKEHCFYVLAPRKIYDLNAFDN